MKTKNKSKSRPIRNKRGGAAVVEFAVVLPLIMLLLLGTIEMGRAIMVGHALQEAAQAACRLHAVRDTPLEDANAIIATSMSRANIQDYSVQFEPATKGEIDEPMEPVTVSITVNFADVAWLAPSYMSGSAIRAQCVMPADVEIATTGT